MNHLSHAELVDLIEESPRVAARTRPTLRNVRRCRAEGEALRAALRLAAADDIPAPSPLFWDHLLGPCVRARYASTHRGRGRSTAYGGCAAPWHPGPRPEQ